MKRHIVLVMELCEYDLDYLVKKQNFTEDDITRFLLQLCESSHYSHVTACSSKCVLNTVLITASHAVISIFGRCGSGQDVMVESAALFWKFADYI